MMGGVGVLLILAGRYSHGGIPIPVGDGVDVGWVTILRGVLLVLAGFVVLHLVGAVVSAVKAATGENRQASIGQGIAVSGLFWLASDKAELDKRAIGWTVAGFAGLVVLALLPAWVWVGAQVAGVGLLVGMVLGVLWPELFPEVPRWARFVPWLEGRERAARPAEGDPGRDARKIKREWRPTVLDLLSKVEGGPRGNGPKPKVPKLIGLPRVTHRAVSVTIEPPDAWPRDYVSQFGGWLLHRWNGKQLEIGNAEAGRLSRRRMTIDIVLEPMPDTLPMPSPIVVSPRGGVPLGEDLLGNVVYLEVGPRGVPHVLVAGTSGSGKSTGMRGMGLGLVAAGAEVIGIDPKGEGDLEGMGASRVLYTAAEWCDHFLWLLDEQEKRRALKRRGEDFGRPIVSMIDEVIQIATGLGARDTAEQKLLGKAHKGYARAVFIGRGVGLHLFSGTQQASAAAFGKDLGTAIRNQHLGRIIFGRGAMRQDVDMVMAGRPITPEDLEQMVEAPKGRAWVSGMVDNGDMRIRAMQFYLVPEVHESLRADREEREARGHDGSELLDADGWSGQSEPPADEVGERRALRDLVIDELARHGSLERAELCRRISDPPIDVSTMRGTLTRLERAGLVRLSGGQGNTPVVVHLAAERLPAGG